MSAALPTNGCKEFSRSQPGFPGQVPWGPSGFFILADGARDFPSLPVSFKVMADHFQIAYSPCAYSHLLPLARVERAREWGLSASEEDLPLHIAIIWCLSLGYIERELLSQEFIIELSMNIQWGELSAKPNVPSVPNSMCFEVPEAGILWKREKDSSLVVN